MNRHVSAVGPVSRASTLLLALSAGLVVAPMASPLTAQDTATSEVSPRLTPAAARGLLPDVRETLRGCEPLEMTVGGEGGTSRFSTVREALRHAAREDACAVKLRLRAGEHRGSFRVDRDVEILGPRRGTASIAGTVSLRGPHSLRVRSVHLRDAGAPGAVVVDHPDARLELRYLTVAGAAGHGVRQRGGRLVMDRVNVFGTRALADFSTSGVGIGLGEGVRARLSGITLSGNEGQALVARGRGTRVLARRLRVVATGHRPGAPLPALDLPPSYLRTLDGAPITGARAAPPADPGPDGEDGELDGTGAVEVAHGATLLARELRMSSNEWLGLHVHDGGRAHVRGGVVRGTRSVESDGGVNVGVVAGSAELRSVTLAGGDLAGLLVARDGSVRIRDSSTVTRNAIGVVLRSEHPVDCLGRDTRYVDNEINLDARADQVSGPLTGGVEDLLEGGSGGEPVDCARVPWRWP